MAGGNAPSIVNTIDICFIPTDGKRQRIGAKQQSTKVNSSLIKNGFSLRIRTIPEIKDTSVFFKLSNSFCEIFGLIIWSKSGSQSLSILCIRSLHSAFSLGYIGSSGG